MGEAGRGRGLFVAMALTALAFAAQYFGGLFVVGDAFQSYAFFNLVVSNLRVAGELPQWLPFTVFGAPAWPYELVFLTPFHLLAALAGALLGVQNLWALYCLATLAELMVFAFGMWLLAGRLFTRAEARAAVVLGAVFLPAWHLQVFWAHRMVVYLPLFLHFTLSLHDSGSLWDLCGLGVTALFSLFGNLTYIAPIYAMICLVTYGASLVFRRSQWRRPGGESWRSPGAWALAVLVVCLLGAYAWIVVGSSQGISFTVPARSEDSARVSRFVFLLYGGSALEKLPDFVAGFPIAHLETFFYIGVVPTGMAVLGLARRRTPEMLTLLVVTTFLFLLSLGKHGGVAYLAYSFPLADHFRHLSFLLPMVRLLLVILAGYGIEALAVPSSKLRAAAVYCVLALLVMLAGKWGWFPLIYLGKWQSYLVECGAALMAAVLLTAWWLRDSNRAGVATTVLAGAFVLELALGQVSMLTIVPNFFPKHGLVFNGVDLALPQPLPWHESRTPDLRAAPQAGTKRALTTRQPVNNTLMMHLIGMEPCVEPHRVDFAVTGTLRYWKELAAEVLPEEDLAAGARLLGQLKLRMKVAANPRLLPECGCGATPKVTLSPGGTAREEAFSANRLELRAEVPPNGGGGGALRYADSWHAGWRATVDGKPAPIEPDGPFKLVRLPEGEHTVEFSFHNALRDGLLRVLAVLACLALWLVLRRAACAALRQPVG